METKPGVIQSTYNMRWVVEGDVVGPLGDDLTKRWKSIWIFAIYKRIQTLAYAAALT